MIDTILLQEKMKKNNGQEVSKDKIIVLDD